MLFGNNSQLLDTIRKRQVEFLGRVVRTSKLKNLEVTGKIEGKEGEEG